MASITIRQLDDDLKARLRVRAAKRGRSMEEEARDILRTSLSETRERATNLAASIRGRFACLGDITLPLPLRQPIRDLPPLDAVPVKTFKTAVSTWSIPGNADRR